jgi:hypothetical protein
MTIEEQPEEKLPKGEAKPDEVVEHDPIEGVEDEATAKVDTELDEAATEDEREEIRTRRRAERKSRSQRNRERVETLERNLQAVIDQNKTLQQQVSGIQNMNVGSQLAQVDAAIDTANKAAEHFKGVIAAAATRNDGRTIAEATEYMIASRQRANDLSAFKQNATRAINAPKPLNPALISKSQEFLAKNKWYGGPTSSDPDSKVLTALDNSLTAEGWDPTSDAYWSELGKRSEKYLAHRSQGAQGKQRSPVSGGSSGGSGGSGDSTAFTLSKEQVDAIKSAGMWDDATKRAKMIKNYQQYNKQSRG